MSLPAMDSCRATVQTLGEPYLLWTVGSGEGLFLHVGQRSVGHGQGDCRGDGDQNETHRTDHVVKARRRFLRCGD